MLVAVQMLLFIIGVSYASKPFGNCAHYSSRKAEIETTIEVGEDEEGYPCHYEHHKVDCYDEQLKTTFIKLVPELENNVVKELKMEKNQITALYESQIMPSQAANIEKLDFSYNLICYIEDGAFSGMNKLEELDLSFNYLEELGDETFGLLPKLMDLKLRNNRLQNLTNPVFEELRSLKYLNLENNPIGFLSRDTFRDLDELEELNLDNTELRFVDKEWFYELPKLKTLLLRRNKFLVAPVLYLPSLERLDISSNPIIELNAHAFEGLDHLQELTISNMSQMWAIEECAFCGLNRLKRLLIYKCPMLYYIDPEAYGPKHYFQNQIEIVDLARNNLTSLSKSLFPWRNVTSLKLSDNPWHCDCNLAWMNDPKLNIQDGDPL